MEPVDIRAVLTDVIMRSGWDHVTQGLISLAFLLLDIPDTSDGKGGDECEQWVLIIGRFCHHFW